MLKLAASINISHGLHLHPICCSHWLAMTQAGAHYKPLVQWTLLQILSLQEAPSSRYATIAALLWNQVIWLLLLSVPLLKSV
jgi:hypothetical protein